MLAEQSGVYVRLKIHILPAFNQCLKSLSVAAVGALACFVPHPPTAVGGTRHLTDFITRDVSAALLRVLNGKP